MNTACRGGGGRAPVMLGVRVIVAWLGIAATMLAFSSNKGGNAPAREMAPLAMITCSWSGSRECFFDGTYVIDSSGSRFKVLATSLANMPDEAVARNLSDRSGLSVFVKSNPWYMSTPYSIATCGKSGCRKSRYATSRDGVIFLLEPSPSMGDTREV
mgnify:CR=1 FL=1